MGNSNNTRLLLVLPLLTLLLSGCMSFNPFADDGGIKVEAQVGKTNEKVQGVKAEEFTVSKVEETTTADTVIEDTKVGTIEADEVSIDERVPFWIWLLMIIGWLLPSPQEIWKGLGTLFIHIKKYIRN